MKNKKNLAICLALFALGAGLVLLAPHITLADTSDAYGIGATGGAAGLTTGNTSVPQIIGSVIKGALSLVGVIFLILMIYAGYLWMIARGESEKVERALNTIKAAIIGIVIVALAYAITNYIIIQVLTKSSSGTTGTTVGSDCRTTGCPNGQSCANVTTVTGSANPTWACN